MDAFGMFTFARKVGQVPVSPEIGNIGTGLDAEINFGSYGVYQDLLKSFAVLTRALASYK